MEEPSIVCILLLDKFGKKYNEILTACGKSKNNVIIAKICKRKKNCLIGTSVFGRFHKHIVLCSLNLFGNSCKISYK